MAARSYSTSAPKRFKACDRRELLENNNRICDLPDEILDSILSLLTMKQAGKTSMLSRRWRHLWAYIPTLNFDSGKRLEVEEVPKYLGWVDQVVSLHKAPTLDEFRVRFLIPTKTRDCIDSWVRFAADKRVKRLAIDLSNNHLESYDDYFFSSHRSSIVEGLLFCNSLTSLDLNRVNISAQVVESLLSSCLALEHLSMSTLDSIVSLQISGPSLSLKCLRIHHCCSIKQLEISAPNLVSLSYCGQEIHVRLTNTPKLAKISFAGGYTCNFVSTLSDIGCYVSQIEVLNLHIPLLQKQDRHILFNTATLFKEPAEYPVFEKLKKLDVRVKQTEVDFSLFFLVSLITACPLLHHFKLELDGYGMRRRKIKKHEIYPHYNLRIVEIVGFVGCAIDLEFGQYLMEAAASLEKFIVDTRAIIFIGTGSEFEVTPQRRRARKRAAERLGPFLKAGTDLVIQ